MNDEDLQILTDAISKLRKIRSKHILAEIERIRQDGNSLANIKTLKVLETELEDILMKESTAHYISSKRNK